jgi:aspartate/methionine/tyrosine aminotransferase
VARGVPGDPARDFAVDPDDLFQRLSRRSRVVLLGAPMIPAGVVWDEGTLQRLAEIAIGRNLVVIADESYETFVYDGATHRSIATLPGMAERTITINGFSTAYAMRSWRVGYMVGPQPLLGPMMKLKQALSICSPAISQYAALAAITGPTTPTDEARDLVEERRRTLWPALQRAGVGFGYSVAGYHVMVDGTGTGLSGRKLAQHVARRAQVRLQPGSLFGAATSSWLRLSLSQSNERLVLAAERLGGVLNRAAPEGVTHA